MSPALALGLETKDFNDIIVLKLMQWWQDCQDRPTGVQQMVCGGDLKEAAAKQAKRGRAEKARERVWGAVVGGAKVDTDCGRCQRKSKGQT